MSWYRIDMDKVALMLHLLWYNVNLSHNDFFYQRESMSFKTLEGSGLFVFRIWPTALGLKSPRLTGVDWGCVRGRGAEISRAPAVCRGAPEQRKWWYVYCDIIFCLLEGNLRGHVITFSTGGAPLKDTFSWFVHWNFTLDSSLSQFVSWNGTLVDSFS